MGDGPEHQLLSKDDGRRKKKKKKDPAAGGGIQVPLRSHRTPLARRYHDGMGRQGQRDTDQKKRSRSQKQTVLDLHPELCPHPFLKTNIENFMAGPAYKMQHAIANELDGSLRWISGRRESNFEKKK